MGFGVVGFGVTGFGAAGLRMEEGRWRGAAGQEGEAPWARGAKERKRRRIGAKTRECEEREKPNWQKAEGRWGQPEEELEKGSGQPARNEQE